MNTTSTSWEASATVVRGLADDSIRSQAPVRRLARILTVHLQGLHVMTRAGASAAQFADAAAAMLTALERG